MINTEKIEKDFPILKRDIYGKPLVYFDNAATTQKPQIVIDEIVNFYKLYNSNIHRGLHYLSEIATKKYENARETVVKFINAKSKKEVVFTKGTTESINLVAYSYGQLLKKGDEIIISQMEHHSNIVPWQLLKDRIGIEIKVIPLTKDFQLNYQEFELLLSEKTKLVSIMHISNSLGTINDIKKIIDLSHKNNTPVLIDAAQSVQHLAIDVQQLDCDFLVFSGHKLYAETGIGILYGKEKWLEKMPPYQGGGDMIKDVSFKKTTYADLPLKFEAGTSNFVGAHSLKIAIDYITEIGLSNICQYETELLEYAIKKAKDIDEIILYSTSQKNKTSVLSFNIKDIHFSDIGTMLDKYGIAVRTGSHCTQPLMNSLGIDGTVRASFAFINRKDEIDFFVETLKKVIYLFK